MADCPECATYVGEPGHNDRWMDLSAAAIEARRARAAATGRVLESIARDRLDAADQLNFDLLRRIVALAIEGARFPGELLAISQLEGPQYRADVVGVSPARTVADYEALLARLAVLPTYLAQVTALLRRGLETGVTPPRITLRDVPAQVQGLLTDDPLESPLLAPFTRILPNLPDAERACFDRGHRAAGRRELVRVQRARADDDVTYPPRDPRDRAGRGRAHPRRHGQRDARDGVRRHVRGGHGIPAHRSALFLRGLGEPGRGVPRDRQAHRSGAGETVREAAAAALWRRHHPRLRGAVADDRLLHARLAGWRSGRAVLCQHVRARHAPEVGDGGADRARGRTWSSPPDRPRPGAHGAAALPPFRRRDRVRGGVGTLRGESRPRAGSVPGSLLEVRPAHLRDVARHSTRHRHRHACLRLEPPAGDRLLHWQQRQDRERHHGRGGPLHQLARPGACLQDRRAQDPGVAGARRELGNAFDIRAFHDRLLGEGALPLEVLESRMRSWIATVKHGERP